MVKKKTYKTTTAQQKAVKDYKERRTNKALVNALELDLIQQKDIESAKGLFDSCYSRYYQCGGTTTSYGKNGIKCEFDSPETFFFDVLYNNGLWTEWKELYEEYLRQGKFNYRPEIHRINKKGNYNMKNIAILPKHEHLKVDIGKSGNAAIFKNGELIDRFKYDSRKEFIEYLKAKNEYPSSKIVYLKHDLADLQQLNDDTFILAQYDNVDLQDSIKNYRLELSNFKTYIINEKNEIVSCITYPNIKQNYIASNFKMNK